MRSDAEIKRLLLATAARGEGSADAFEALYKACAPLLFGIAQRIVRRRELAEEVLHDGFTRIWKAAERFDPLAEQPVAWMAAIVRNRALDLMASHDVSRVDSYSEESELDRLFDWAPAADPERLVPGQRMSYRVPEAADRAALIAFLEAN